MNMYTHSLTKIFVLLLFSFGVYSCGEKKNNNTVESDVIGAANTDKRSSDSTQTSVSSNTATKELALGQEALKFKSALLDDPALMNMEQKETIIKYDLSSLFTQTSSHQIFGFIGDNYQRIKIKFISVKKNSNTPDLYTVKGMTKVKNNICVFNGSMRVISSRQRLENDLESDTIRQGFILFDYSFYEDSTQKGTGIFNGVAVSYYYINKHGQLNYDDLMSGADGFSNNLFVGEWKGYKSSTAKRCNWGDHRIPNSGEFDKGASFIPPKNTNKMAGQIILMLILLIPVILRLQSVNRQNGGSDSERSKSVSNRIKDRVGYLFRSSDKERTMLLL